MIFFNPFVFWQTRNNDPAAALPQKGRRPLSEVQRDWFDIHRDVAELASYGSTTGDKLRMLETIQTRLVDCPSLDQGMLSELELCVSKLPEIRQLLRHGDHSKAGQLAKQAISQADVALNVKDVN